MNEQTEMLFDYTHIEISILSLLQKGRANAQGVKFLCEETGLSDVQLRKMIRHLIVVHDVLIASATHEPAGYFIPETEDEVLTATKTLRSRGIAILFRASRLQKLSLEEIFNQARLELKG